MKKNGIVFNLQEQKFHQGAYCAICGEKIVQGDMEYISECTPYMHLCRMCAISKSNIPPKKGMSVKINNRLYMWVSKGIRGNHVCALTNQEIKNGTPCWWSSSKDDPEHHADSYILTLDNIAEPNEWKAGEKTPICSFENNLIVEDDKVFVEEKVNTKFINPILNKNKIKKDVVDEFDDWGDPNYIPVSDKHLEEDITSFFKQVYGIDKSNINYISKKSKEPYISLIDYVKMVIPQDKIYFVFWQENKLLVTTRDRIFQAVKTVGIENAMKLISDIKIPLTTMICDIYEKVNNCWLRRD